MDSNDTLCLGLLMNNSKRRCVKCDKPTAVCVPPESDKTVRNGLETVVDSFQSDIINNSFILSNFDTFINRLTTVIRKFIITFEKEFNGKQD